MNQIPSGSGDVVVNGMMMMMMSTVKPSPQTLAPILASLLPGVLCSGIYKLGGEAVGFIECK